MTGLTNTCLRVIINYKFRTSTLVYHKNFVTSFKFFLERRNALSLKVLSQFKYHVQFVIWQKKLILSSDVYKPEKVGVY